MSVTADQVKSVIESSRFAELLVLLRKPETAQRAKDVADAIARHNGVAIPAVRAAVRFVQAKDKANALIAMHLLPKPKSAFEERCALREQLKRDVHILPCTPEKLAEDAAFFAATK